MKQMGFCVLGGMEILHGSGCIKQNAKYKINRKQRTLRFMLIQEGLCRHTQTTKPKQILNPKPFYTAQ